MDRKDTHMGAGELKQAFDAIATELEKVRKVSEAYNRQLLQRNRELAATAAVAQATSAERLDLAGTLEQALQAVLEVTSLSAGWIMLLPEGGGEPALASSVGLPPDIAKNQAALRSPECECQKAMESRRPVVIYPLHTSCPIRSLKPGMAGSLPGPS